MKIKQVDHICFAVKSLDEARRVYEDVLGFEPACEYTSEEESIKVVRYYAGEVAIELLEPTKPDCEVARFLRKRGEGFFLISYKVDDVTESLAEVRATGRKTIDAVPRSLMGSRYAFLEPPAAMHGVLIELIDGDFLAQGSPIPQE